MNHPIELAFEHHYEVEPIEVPPGIIASYDKFFPCLVDRGPYDGLYIRIKPQSGRDWIGRFSSGGGGLTGLYSAPNPEFLCVAFEGNVFFVCASDPERYATHITPAWQIFQVLDSQMLLISEVTGIRAMGINGPLWVTSGLIDPMIEQITDNTIEGISEDCGKSVRFVVDKTTGNVISVEKRMP